MRRRLSHPRHRRQPRPVSRAVRRRFWPLTGRRNSITMGGSRNGGPPMGTTSAFLQYFNIEKMGRFPNGADALLTTRMGVFSKLAAVQQAKGGTVYVVSGFGKPKKYVLWEVFTIEDVSKQDDQFVVSGPGRVLLPPATLEGKEFERFKTACANFVGFRRIDDQPYRDTL